MVELKEEKARAGAVPSGQDQEQSYLRKALIAPSDHIMPTTYPASCALTSPSIEIHQEDK